MDAVSPTSFIQSSTVARHVATTLFALDALHIDDGRVGNGLRKAVAE